MKNYPYLKQVDSFYLELLTHNVWSVFSLNWTNRIYFSSAALDSICFPNFCSWYKIIFTVSKFIGPEMIRSQSFILLIRSAAAAHCVCMLQHVQADQWHLTALRRWFDKLIIFTSRKETSFKLITKFISFQNHKL